MDNILTRRVSPIHISFPLRRAPRLTLSVWRRFDPEADSPLQIEVTNTGGTPLEITGVSVGFMRTFLPAELLLGQRAVRFPLGELSGDAPPPRVLDGGSARWTAELSQVKEQLIEEQLRSSPRLRRVYADLEASGYPHLDRFYTELTEISPEWENAPRGRLAIRANNLARQMAERHLAVVVEYGQGGLYKAEARWKYPHEEIDRYTRRIR